MPVDMAEIVGVKTVHKFAAIGAHPDDAELGCGGKLSKEKGLIIVLSYGLNGTRDRFRTREEQEEAADKLGCDYVILDYDEVPCPNQTIVSQLDNVLEAYNIGEVLTHHPRDTHQEHRWASEIAQAAARNIHRVAFWEGQPPSGQHPYFHPHLYCDISGEHSFKYQAIGCYKSQNVPRSLSSNRIKLDMWRGAECGADYAEAYEVLRWRMGGI